MTLSATTTARREAALLKSGALQDAIFNSANFSSIATDEHGVIQLFNKPTRVNEFMAALDAAIEAAGSAARHRGR